MSQNGLLYDFESARGDPRRRSTRQPRTHRKGGASQRGRTAKASRRGRIPSPDVGVPILSLSALAAVLGTTGKEMKNFLFYSAYWVSSKARKKVVLEPWAHLNKSPGRAARDGAFSPKPCPHAQPSQGRKCYFKNCCWCHKQTLFQRGRFSVANENHLSLQYR